MAKSPSRTNITKSLTQPAMRVNSNVSTNARCRNQTQAEIEQEESIKLKYDDKVACEVRKAQIVKPNSMQRIMEKIICCLTMFPRARAAMIAGSRVKVCIAAIW